MGIIKNLLKKFSCKSKCAFNQEDFSDSIKSVDLSKYQLKVSDLMRIEKIIKKRPSIHTYLHDEDVKMDITEV